MAAAPTESTNGTTTGNAAEDELANFVSIVLQDTEDVWTKLFPEQLGRTYQKPVLVIFSGETVSGCGRANAATVFTAPPTKSCTLT
ncbi:MAG: neutral zinc metallopeptidase [Saprospiraceae bacterium]